MRDFAVTFAAFFYQFAFKKRKEENSSSRCSQSHGQLAIVCSWLVSKLSISEPGCGGNLWQRRERGERGTKNGGCQLLFYYTVYQYATCLRVNVATTQNLFECPALQMTCHCRDSTVFLFFVFKRLCRRFPKFSRKNFKKETPFRFISFISTLLYNF